MGIFIRDRPSKTLSNGFLSKWSSSELPLQYKLDSNVFPINKIDTQYNITSLQYYSSEKGVRIQFDSNHNYSALKVVTINGTDTELDGGNYSIKKIISSSIIYIDTYTTDTSNTGTSVRYYPNYKGLVKVFAGSPDQHPYNLDGSKPLEEIGIIEVDFNYVDDENIGFANVNGYVKAVINAKFDADENTHFGWSSFYVQYTETFEDVLNGETYTRTGDFLDDLTTSCDPFTDFVDPSFDNGLTDWSEDSSGSSWVGGVGSVSISTTSSSNVLYQSKELKAGIPYYVDVNYDIDVLGGGVVLILNPGNGGVFSNANRYIEFIHVSGAGSFRFNFTPSKDFDSLGVSLSSYNGTSVSIDLNDVNINTNVAQPCLYTQWANFGAKQFQDDLGGNFGDYVLNVVDTITPKMLTHFEEKTYFVGKPFYFSSIIPQSTFSLSEDSDNLNLDVKLYNGSEVVHSFSYSVDNNGEGVYTVDVSGEIPTDIEWNSGTAQFTIVPGNTFTDGDNGTFEDGTPANWNISNLSPIVFDVEVGTPSKTGAYSCRFTSSFSSLNSGEIELYKFDTPIQTNIGLDYVFNFYYYRDNNFSINLVDNAYVYFKIEGTDVITNKFLLRNTLPTPFDWIPLSVTFTPTTESINLIMCIEPIENITTAGGFALLIDDVTFKGPIEYISEIKPIKKGDDCTLYGGTLRWMSDLNGWDSWYFSKKKITKEKVGKKIDVINDYATDWDTNFIDGDTQRDTIKTTVNRSIVLKSQLLTTNQKTVLEQIKRSARVQYLTDSGKWQTVTVRAGAYNVIDESEKVHEMEIEINLPDLVIQAQ